MQFVRWAVSIAACVIVLSTACVAPQDERLARFEYSRLAMGVEARVVLYARTERAAIDAANAAFARIAALDDELSDWKATSELSRISDHAGSGPIEASDDVRRVLTLARTFAEASGGAFDPTIGPLVALWRRARRERALPNSHELDRARSLVDWRALHVDDDARTVTLDRAGMRLDLGAIGKGFAAQEALTTLAARGTTRALVALSGDVACNDAPPGRSGWTIELCDGSRVELAHAAASTSGDTQQFVEIGGVRYSHDVDPRTGYGVRSRTLVTVIAPYGATADALSTAACVLGARAGSDWITRFERCRAVFGAP